MIQFTMHSVPPKAEKCKGGGKKEGRRGLAYKAGRLKLLKTVFLLIKLRYN
jgi:hypothetical protein